MADSILDGKNKAIEDLAKMVSEEKAAEDKEKSTSPDDKTS
jgi:hypothetical protein